MPDPAAFEAQYTGFSYLKTADEYKVTLAVPKHQWAQVYRVLGDPPSAGECKWVGVAVLQKPEEA
jgi:hypothetical protein